MDTSETYVKMCEKATEIQAEKVEYRQGDYFAGKSIEWQIVMCSRKGGTPILLMTVWLPRQDQLQEMLFDTEHIFARVVLLKEFVRQNERYILNKMRSFEQLWLAFVMQERYSKIWNGEDWIKKLGGEHE